MSESGAVAVVIVAVAVAVAVPEAEAEYSTVVQFEVIVDAWEVDSQEEEESRCFAVVKGD